MFELLSFTVTGQPITKKNSQRIITNPRTKRPMILPSKQYLEYRKLFLSETLKLKLNEPIGSPVNVQAVYYMGTRRKVDLTNLLSATHDLLVDAKILIDDNCKVAVSVDGSRVRYDKERPRVEIRITEAEKND